MIFFLVGEPNPLFDVLALIVQRVTPLVDLLCNGSIQMTMMRIGLFKSMMRCRAVYGLVAATAIAWSVLLPMVATAQGGVECLADAGTLTGDGSVCFEAGGVTIMATPGGDAVVPTGYSTLYVLTSGDDLVIEAVSPDPSFLVTSLGEFRIHTLVYDSATLDLSGVEFGTTTGADILSLLIGGGGSICASLDVTGLLVTVADPDAGGLTPTLDDICLLDGMAIVEATPDGDMDVPDGFSVIYVLTMGEDLVISQTNDFPAFMVDAVGMYTIHTLVYDSATLDLSTVVPGVTTGGDIHALLVQGGGDICGSLDVGGAPVSVLDCGDVCTAFAGTLIATDATPCLVEGEAVLHASHDEMPFVPEGFSMIHVLTSGDDLVIEAVGAEPQFTVDATGTYTIHTLIYDSTTIDLGIVVPGETTGFAIFALLISGGGEICGALDVDGAMFTVTECSVICQADAGSISATSSFVCMEEGSAMISASAATGLTVPDGYEVRYVLTSGAALVIEQVSMDPMFTVSAAGSYTIHTLVYNPMTLDLSTVTPGVTTGGDVNALLIAGGGEICGALDVEGAAITVSECDDECLAYAGTLQGYKPVFCYEESGTDIAAIGAGDAVVPADYHMVYLLANDAGVIIDMDATYPYFTVDMEGSYSIHAFVYRQSTFPISTIVLGVTTLSDLDDMTISGGGGICADLDTEGVDVLVASPDPGTLTADLGTVCLENGSVTLTAMPAGDMDLPPGYVAAYLLVMGEMEDAMIVQMSATPSFVVTEPGHYAIQGFVYDPATFPIDDVVGMDGWDFFSMLIQGGGMYCAVVDEVGVKFMVIECDDECDAVAGTLVSDLGSVCLEEGTVTVTATPVDPAVVPPGYVSTYILVMGDSATVMQMGPDPSFTITEPGHYAIQNFVYDPATFPIGDIELGEMWGYDLYTMLIQGGGPYCAAIDEIGAKVWVLDCDEDCTADAGMLDPIDIETCLDEGSVTFGAEVAAPMNVPAGYSVGYVLTMGAELVITAVSTTPEFTVTMAGDYTIHTLVYDPATLDLSSIVFGVTTGFDVNGLLIQGGGTICGALDVEGATTHVIDCSEECLAFAGTLSTDTALVCLFEGMGTLSATASGTAVVPPGSGIIYVLTSGGMIVSVADAPTFMVTTEGEYTIHGLVYDPMTLNLGFIVPGVTEVTEMLLLLADPTICADLDITGVTFTVDDCIGEIVIDNVWPVPAQDQITVQLNVPAGANTSLVMVSMTGAEVMPARAIAAGTNQVVLNVGGLDAGYYTLRLVGDNGVSTYNFSKVR